MMSQIHCKQSIRIEKSGWFKHYFPGNLRRRACPPLFHGRTGWAESFFVGFGNWYRYKPETKYSFSDYRENNV